MRETSLSSLCLTIVTAVTATASLSVAEAAPKATKSAKPAKPAAAKPVQTESDRFKVSPVAAEPMKLSLREVRPTDAAGFAPREIASPEAKVEGQFALSPAATYGDVRLLDADRYYDGRGPVSWRSNAFVVGESDGGAVDSVRVSVAAVARNAAVAPLSLVRPDAHAFDAENIDVTLTRGWPSAVKLAAGKFALDVSPHAGFGFGDAGGSAEAGATVRLGKNIEDRVTDSLGLRDGDEAFGPRGRWYVFAAASGRAVGLNMLRGQNGDWSRAGMSADVNSKLIGDAQAGVAWRKGPMQASVGYIHREMKAKDVIMGMATQKDSMVALSFSLKPNW
ncbi:hypothetical protein AQ619_01025 [Caulobacter henricii]|uniref:DUF2219 domain-containing protein n=1 Tax=Caulobacter henricii TaxID=69395 RepID=A0A0P0P3U4_9CAUL|nr:hypothetical protein AQ619_01025 [Caulobacter henricii]